MAVSASHRRCVADSVGTWGPVQGSQIIAAVCYSSQIGWRTGSWQGKINKLGYIKSKIAHRLT